MGINASQGERSGQIDDSTSNHASVFEQDKEGYGSQRAAEGARQALEELLAAPERRRDELWAQNRARELAALINQLGEDTAVQAPHPTVGFLQAVSDMVVAHEQSPVYRELLKAINPTVEMFSHARVLYLALGGVKIERFMSLLPWVRESVSKRFHILPSTQAALLEAQLWGVDMPNADQVHGFIQGCVSLGSCYQDHSDFVPSARRALIQRSGVLRLEEALHMASKRLESINPPGVWAAHPKQMGAKEAGERYVQAVESVIPRKYRDVSANLAAIAWNMDRIVPRDPATVGQALTPRELVSTTLTAAVLNRAGAEALRSLYSDIRTCADRSADVGAVKRSFRAINSSLRLEENSPHRHFLKRVVECSRAYPLGVGILAAAWSEVCGGFHRNALADLRWLEAGVLQFSEPAELPVRGIHDSSHSARNILSSALEQYRRVTLGSLPLQVLGRRGELRSAAEHGPRTTKIGPAKIAKLLQLSEVLAGIPWTAKQTLSSNDE